MSKDKKIDFEFLLNAINSGDEEKLEEVLQDFLHWIRHEDPRMWDMLKSMGMTDEQIIERSRAHILNPDAAKKSLEKAESRHNFEKEYQ
ncbi:hypothetical protein N9N26_00665 [Candidatus Poseidoniales archaeon]|jgi:hypothetical protein|nr:hypothetical protein [Candidatus Poseidoniales archaeon]